MARGDLYRLQQAANGITPIGTDRGDYYRAQQGEVKRGPGRPRTGRKDRIDVTISKDDVQFIDWLIGPQGNVSAFIGEQVKAHPRYEEWKKDQEKK